MSQNEAKRYIRQEPLPFGDYLHPSNREVIDPSTPRVWSHLDYFSATFGYPEMDMHGTKIMTPFWREWFDVSHQIDGVRFYRSGAQLFPAGRLYWNGSQKERGGYLIMSGDELALVRNYHKVDDKQFLVRMMPFVQSVTRLDFCTNIEDGHPRQALKHWRKGKKVSRARTCERHDEFSKRRGYTVYIGSDQSDKMLRVYDKIAELKLDGGVWTRIEMQLRNEPALRLADVMRRNDVKASGKTAIRNFVDFPELEWYQLATQSDNVEMTLTPSRETSFMRWLNEQVAPGIEKRLAANIDTCEIVEWIENIRQVSEEYRAAHDCT